MKAPALGLVPWGGIVRYAFPVKLLTARWNNIPYVTKVAHVSLQPPASVLAAG